MMASYASNLAVLSQHLSGHATTPTAATFAASRASRTSRRRSFTDCDEGDILDDLVGPTSSRPHSQRESRRAVVEEEDDEDDNTSTCSSVTAAAADNSSFSSRGRSRFSDVASITSVNEADSRTASVRPVGGNTGNGGKNGRRRRRRNNRGRAAQTEAEAISETASETAYETASVTDSVASSIPKNRSNRKSRNNNNRVQQLKDDNPKTNRNSSSVKSNGNVKNSNKATTKQIKVSRNESPAPPARRSRSTLGVNSRESTVTSRGKPRRSRHPQLIIGLDLDAEIELKSRVQGDICLTLVGRS